MTTDRHIIRYTTASGDRYLQTKPLEWWAAISLWHDLDELRRQGRLPWVRHFEVRSASDPTNPDVYLPTREWRGEGRYPRGDHHSNLRLGLNLVEDQNVYTFQCLTCGKAYQGSGLGFGSHRRVCPALTGESVLAIAARELTPVR